VLDIGCGGGALGFLIEKDGKQYTGVDINPDMIRIARAYAKKTKSHAKFILADATNTKITGHFNTITFLGNGLCHLTTHDFVRLLDNTKRNVSKGTTFIIDYRDVVSLLFNRQWKMRMVEGKTGKKFISITIGCDTVGGEIKKFVHTPDNKIKFSFTHTIWSPFILEPLMKASGWKLISRKKNPTWQGWVDVYKKAE
jgi:SAM-dependent methyltransferase